VARRALASLRWRVACRIIGFVAVLLFEQGACSSHGLFASFAPDVAWRLPYVSVYVRPRWRYHSCCRAERPLACLGAAGIGGGGGVAGDWWCACAGDARERGAARGTYFSYLYLTIYYITISISLDPLFFFGERRTPSSGGIESLAWRRHTEPRSLMISQSWATRKLAHHNHARKKKKKSSVFQHRRTQTSP